MRTRQALSGFQLCPVMPLQMLLQLLRQFGNRCKGIGDVGNGFIFQGKFLGTAGKLAVVSRGGFSQTFIKSGPVGDQQGTHLAQPGVVFRQNLQNTRIFKMVLQNPVFLIQDPAVFRQGRIIIWPQLAQGMIAQPPPLGGAAFQHHQILRAEQHRGQHPENF